eukprot:14230309-Alexandrium_andersonii.AAC.1
MSASLVGSEMCIRDSRRHHRPRPARLGHGRGRRLRSRRARAAYATQGCVNQQHMLGRRGSPATRWRRVL